MYINFFQLSENSVKIDLHLDENLVKEKWLSNIYIFKLRGSGSVFG